MLKYTLSLVLFNFTWLDLKFRINVSYFIIISILQKLIVKYNGRIFL